MSFLWVLQLSPTRKVYWLDYVILENSCWYVLSERIQRFNFSYLSQCVKKRPSTPENLNLELIFISNRINNLEAILISFRGVKPEGLSLAHWLSRGMHN